MWNIEGKRVNAAGDLKATCIFEANIVNIHSFWYRTGNFCSLHEGFSYKTHSFFTFVIWSVGSLSSPLCFFRSVFKFDLCFCLIASLFLTTCCHRVFTLLLNFPLGQFLNVFFLLCLFKNDKFPLKILINLIYFT